MLLESLLLWGTGREGWWRVQVEDQPSDIRGFRQAVGPITASAGRLCLTHYESLTMGAQFADIVLPEPHERSLILTVPAGRYNCRVLQLNDPMAAPPAAGPDFLVQLQSTDQPVAPWRQVVWAPPGLPG